MASIFAMRDAGQEVFNVHAEWTSTGQIVNCQRIPVLFLIKSMAAKCLSRADRRHTLGPAATLDAE